MAKKAPVAPAPEAVDEDAPKGRSKLLLPLLIVVVLAVVAAGLMFSGMIGGSDDAEASDPLAEPTAAPTPTELGMVVQLDSVTLNLAAGRFLKLGVAVELAAGVTAEPPTAPIYDEVIELFAPMTFEELSTAAVREQTKTSLLTGLSETYGQDIVGVYYTEFVMQ